MAAPVNIQAEAEVTHLIDLPVRLIKEGKVEGKARITLELIKHSPNTHRVNAQEAIQDIFDKIQPVPPEMKNNLTDCTLHVCLDNGEKHRLGPTDIVHDHCKTLAKEGSTLLVVDPFTVVDDIKRCDLSVMAVHTKENNQ